MIYQMVQHSTNNFIAFILLEFWCIHKFFILCGISKKKLPKCWEVLLYLIQNYAITPQNFPCILKTLQILDFMIIILIIKYQIIFKKQNFNSINFVYIIQKIFSKIKYKKKLKFMQFKMVSYLCT
jgi:hypothetical protein